MDTGMYMYGLSREITQGNLVGQTLWPLSPPAYLFTASDLQWMNPRKARGQGIYRYCPSRSVPWEKREWRDGQMEVIQHRHQAI